jgi:hypothetical protein
LLRARFDRWWIRGAFRLAAWAAVVGVGVWAYQEYWPTSERDIEADEALATASVLVVSDLSDASWSPGTARLVSPLELEVDDEGLVTLPACESAIDSISDVEDEPRRIASFASADGLSTIAHSTTVGDGTGFGRDYLENLRQPEMGTCLTALWQSRALGSVTVLSATEMTTSYGDEAVWWRLAGQTTAGAFPRDVFADVVVVRLGPVVVEYVFISELEAMGVDVQRDVISLELARVRELLAARAAVEAEDEEDGGADTGPDSLDGADDEVGVTTDSAGDDGG